MNDTKYFEARFLCFDPIKKKIKIYKFFRKQLNELKTPKKKQKEIFPFYD